jgi:hypothetical protein
VLQAPLSPFESFSTRDDSDRSIPGCALFFFLKPLVFGFQNVIKGVERQFGGFLKRRNSSEISRKREVDLKKNYFRDCEITQWRARHSISPVFSR